MRGLSNTELLAAAERMIDTPDPATRGLWARAAAFLGRQALEETMQELWREKAPGLRRVPFSTQLLCLREYTSDTELAQEAAHVWAALSAACHHHGYGLPPTAGELRAWLAGVRRVTAAFA